MRSAQKSQLVRGSAALVIERPAGKRREAATEVPLCAKTTAAAYAAAETTLRAAHPYELPDILAVPLSHGLPAYLAWIADAIVPPNS